jgi:NTE family protein
VASDIGTGKPVVLGSGDLATAMRASMAVPGAFAATEIDGRLLVDGGITNNLPINVVRDMGADIVIAVDISTPLADPENVRNMLQITGS